MCRLSFSENNLVIFRLIAKVSQILCSTKSRHHLIFSESMDKKLISGLGITGSLISVLAQHSHAHHAREEI